MKTKSRKWYQAVAIVVLCIAFFMAGYFIQPYTIRGESLPIEEGDSAIEPFAMYGTDTEEIELIGADTKFYLVRRYSGSNTVHIKELPIPIELIGMPQDAITRAMPEYKLLSFSPENIYMKQEIEGWGPGAYVLSVYGSGTGESLAVYEFDEEGQRVLKENFDTPISSLPEAEQLNLREGIIVMGEDELYRILENYTS
ncbi:MAG: BofC C-terminal domain-containing protein [Eubacteriaceae bacterium]|jgi:hypothetical protein|nr:BofC C-terminal domain-containing protein [Eubacteriaceae bacterium]